jgi:hypothetical protein
MALETAVSEFRLTTGQDEGTERAVLPAGQFSYLQNVRFRKNQRLGKRNGYTSKTSVDDDGAALGNGSGRLSCLGPHFCVVDDRFYARDTVNDTWALPPEGQDGGPLGGKRLYGRFPQFMPAAARETLPIQSDLDIGAYTGTALPSLSGMTYALGYIWTACSFFADPTGEWLVRVTGFDPATGRTVFMKDIGFTFTTPATVRQDPVLLATGDRNTLVLITDRYTAGVKSAVCVMVLTSLSAGFGAEVYLSCIESAANYDPTAANGIMFMYVEAASPAQFTIARMNPATMVATASATLGTFGNKTLLSCFCNSAGQVWVGYNDATDGLRSRAYNSALVNQGAGATWGARFSDAVGPIMFASRTASTVCAIAGSTDPTGAVLSLDVDSSGGNSGPMRQQNCEALSQPFSIGGQVFVWARHHADAQLGVASLLRVPLFSEYTSAGGFDLRTWPLEATVDDLDVDAPLAAGKSGPPFPTPQSTPLGYAALINYTRETIVTSSGTTELRGFLLTPVRHRSEGIRYSTSCVVPCAGKLFVAGAQPMWVDRLGEYESGFVQAPVVTVTSAGAGTLSSESEYQYCAVYFSIDSNGLVERSAPSLPVSFTTGESGNDCEALVTISRMAVGQRVIRAEFYRTLANGSVFHLINSVDASPGGDVNSVVTLNDESPDSYIEQNKTLYTQVGQELPASQSPACSFANVGGNRLWCAGGFRGNVAQASKLFVPRICPEFADDDAFRVTLPANITGSAWCDNQVFFTQEGIYVIYGDGPDGSGVGFFTQQRLPFNIGCIDWRSVVTTDLGVFFQSARGLYLLPRGFGSPVAMDQVLDTLTTYPIITSARADYDSQGGADDSEQIVQWTAVADEAATTGVVITYDCAYKAFSIDTFSADYPATFQAGWSGDSVQAPATMTVGPGGAGSWHPFRVRDSGYDDNGLTIAMRAVTGDIRPWGLFNHGVVNRVGLLGQLRSACTVTVNKTTDKGASATASRVYTAAGTTGQPAAGTDIYLEVPLGNAEQRDITSLRVTVAETSAVEGVALFGMVTENDAKPQGFRMQGPADRVQ